MKTDQPSKKKNVRQSLCRNVQNMWSTSENQLITQPTDVKIIVYLCTSNRESYRYNSNIHFFAKS